MLVTYSQAQAIVLASTEIHHADHDYNRLAKIILPVILCLNIGRDFMESLVSGGKDGHGKPYVAIHDGVFEK